MGAFDMCAVCCPWLRSRGKLVSNVFFTPQVDAPEAALIPDVDIIPVVSLASLHAHLTGGDQIPVMEYTLPEDLPLDLITTDFAEIKTRFVLNLLSEIMDAWFENRAFFSCYTL